MKIEIFEVEQISKKEHPESSGRELFDDDDQL